MHPLGYRIKKAIVPELGIHARSVSFSLGYQYTEGRQVLIFTAQAITEPGAHAGAVALLGPGLEKGNGRVMVNGIGMQGADNADVVHYLRRMGEQVADPCPGLSVLFEIIIGHYQGKTGLPGGHPGPALSPADDFGGSE